MTETPESDPMLDGVEFDIYHMRRLDGKCVISMNGQGHFPCSEHPEVRFVSAFTPGGAMHPRTVVLELQEVSEVRD